MRVIGDLLVKEFFKEFKELCWKIQNGGVSMFDSLDDLSDSDGDDSDLNGLLEAVNSRDRE